MSINPVFEVEKVTVELQNKKIINDISFHMETGKIYSIIGPNGSGKSTLLKAMTSHLRLKFGQILYLGGDISRKSAKALAKELSILWQKNVTPEDLTVHQLIEYGRFPHRKWGRAYDDTKIIEDTLQTVQMQHLRDKQVSKLSGGEAQRAWLGMALAQEPNVLMLDEPTTYLDISHQLELLELVKRLNRERRTTIVMVLHDLNQASVYSDYLFALKNGRLEYHGTPEDLYTEKFLRDVFRVKAERLRDQETGKPIYHSFKKEE